MTRAGQETSAESGDDICIYPYTPCTPAVRTCIAWQFPQLAYIVPPISLLKN